MRKLNKLMKFLLVLTYINYCQATVSITSGSCKVSNCKKCVLGDLSKCQYCDTPYQVKGGLCFFDSTTATSVAQAAFTASAAKMPLPLLLFLVSEQALEYL